MTIWANGNPAYPAGANPWQQPGFNLVNALPGTSFLTPGVPFSAQELNSLFNATTAYSQQQVTRVALRAAAPPSSGGGLCQITNESFTFSGFSGTIPLGIYAWAPSSTTPDDNLFCIAPTGFATGRWLLQRAPMATVQDLVAENTSAGTTTGTSTNVIDIGLRFGPSPGSALGDVIDVELIVGVSGTIAAGFSEGCTLQFRENTTPVGYQTISAVQNFGGSPLAVIDTKTMRHRHTCVAGDVTTPLVIDVLATGIAGSLTYTNIFSRVWIRRP